MLVVQGGPGTGKTVVALHRAAYLLYTHRFPLEGQGVLVVGPNRLFLGYIDQVLPSLGEAGVELAVLADLIPDEVTIRGYDDPQPARVKGDLRMAKVLAKAVRDRRRPLRDDVVVGYGVQTLRLTVAESARIVDVARRRARTHNVARRFVESAAVRVPGPQRTGRHRSRSGPRPSPPRPCRPWPPSSGCGRCSRRPSCSTTCSARGPCSGWPPGGS